MTSASVVSAHCASDNLELLAEPEPVAMVKTVLHLILPASTLACSKMAMEYLIWNSDNNELQCLRLVASTLAANNFGIHVYIGASSSELRVGSRSRGAGAGLRSRIR